MFIQSSIIWMYETNANVWTTIDWNNEWKYWDRHIGVHFIYVPYDAMSLLIKLIQTYHVITENLIPGSIVFDEYGHVCITLHIDRPNTVLAVPFLISNLFCLHSIHIYGRKFDSVGFSIKCLNIKNLYLINPLQLASKFSRYISVG